MIKKILVISLIFTLPINILGIVWVVNTKNSYELLSKFDLTLVKGNRLIHIGDSELTNVKHEVESLLGNQTKSNVKLFLNDKQLKSLNSNLPFSGTEYQDDALLIIDGQPIKGKAKFRGDNYFHWGFTRKSWRFKTSKKQIYNGINKINLIIPKSVDMLLNHLSYKLAKTIGLLAPESRLVNFSVNSVYKGPRLMVEQIDESFLRKNRRMPNDIYKGDNMGQSKYIGVDVLLFENPSLWEKAAYNNHYKRNDKKPLEKMLDELSQNQLTILDLNSFAKMAAYIDLTGSYHHDKMHNWILYYDNYFEKMYPIIWDTIGWTNYTINLKNMNIATSELLEELYFDYDFFREKYQILTNYFQIQEPEFSHQLQQAVKESKSIISSNKYSFELSRKLHKKQQALALVDEFETGVINRMDYIQDYYFGAANPEAYRYATTQDKIRLSISDSKLVNKVHLQLKTQFQVQQVFIEHKTGDTVKRNNITRSVESGENTLSINLSLFANSSTVSSYKDTKKIDFHEATYDLDIQGLNLEDVQSVSFSIDNLAQEIIEVSLVDDLGQKTFDSRIKNIIPIDAIPKTLTWSGEKRFSGFNIIEDNLVIQAGTKLLFDEGATLKVLGKVTAIGTSEQPIVFDAMDSSKPWGAFALKDERANDSIFKHAIFKNGSGDKGDLYEYTAMFSVHNVQNLLVEKSEFYDSKLTDDMVHIIYSDVKLKDSKFVRSLSDAVDIDISTAVIENCEFINSGNDSIDLMTSDAVVINTVFKDSMDKGISIGEGSNLLAINNLIENSVIGMQSKDTSLANIYNTSFIGNDKAVDAYHKNWRYSEGGSIYVDKCIMQENTENATVGKKSKVIINDCQIDTEANFDAKDIRKAKIVIDEKDYIPATFEQDFFKNHTHLIQKQTQGRY